MVAHVGLITWGYAAGRIGATPGTLWTLTWDYPGMLLAVAGTLFLFLVVATSFRAARRRLRYESWHLLHLYAYLGAGLALPHQLWTGRELLASPAATAYWWTLWGLAAGAVLVWRVALPLWRSARHRLRVTSVVRESADVISVYLTGHRLDRLRAEPGQFFQWRFLGRSGWTRANPYSLSAAPDGRSLRITVKALGDSSTSLATVRPGTRVLVEGPYGRLSPRARTRRKVALFGAGVGITPIRALAEGLAYSPGDAVLLHRFTRDRFGPSTARIAVAALLLYPYAWYLYGTGYSDALYLAAALGAFVLVESDHPVLAGLAGFVATAARPTGVALLAGLLVLAVARRRRDGARWRPADAGVLLAAGGLASWCAYLWVQFGDPLAFLHAEGAPGWDQPPGAHTWLKAAFWDMLGHGDRAFAARLAVQAILGLGFFAAVPWIVRRFGWGYGVFTFVAVGVPLVGTGDFQGIGRYLLAAFPVFALVAEPLARHPRAASAVLATSALSLVVLTSFFARGFYLS
jgi:hypothetical protein